MDGPIISIIIPVYNASEHIIETLESIRNQTFEKWECLLIDDHSSDNTFGLLTNYAVQDSRFKIFKRPNDYAAGGCGARNYGFHISKGIYIQWFDADDLMDSKMLKIKLDNAKGDIDAVICKTISFKGEIKNTIGQGTMIDSENPFEDLFNGKITYYTPGPLWKKEFLLDLGFLFNPKLINVQEWEFYCKILLKRPKIKTVDNNLIYYRKHPKSIWGRQRSIPKIMSEFYAAKSVFQLGESFKNEIIDSYFLRLGKLHIELAKLQSADFEKSEVKRELIKVYFQKSFNLKDIFRLINYIFRLR